MKLEPSILTMLARPSTVTTDSVFGSWMLVRDFVSKSKSFKHIFSGPHRIPSVQGMITWKSEMVRLNYTLHSLI